MKILKDILYWFIIGLLLCFSCLYIRSCQFNDQSQKTGVKLLYQTDTVKIPGDSFPVLVYDTVPNPVAVQPLKRPDQINYDSVLQAFYLALSYADTISQDSSFKIFYRLDISKNKLDSLKIFVQNLRQTKMISNQYMVQKPKAACYIGMGIGGSAHHFMIAPSLIYLDKKSSMYQLQYDFVNNQILAGFYFKFR